MYHLSAVMGINDHLWRQRHKWRLTTLVWLSSLPSPGKATRITRPQKKKLKHVQKDGPSPPPVGHAPLRNGLRTRHGDCLRFGTLNCRSLASDAAKEQLLAANRNALIDIVAFQETKSQDTSCNTWPNGELLILGHKVPGKNVGGVGFLVNRSVQHLVDSHEIVNARLGSPDST
ncbi:unnamed protein product [Caenorhabditis auriculariae]|uniref:Endonuclease/exonuclease/phosphatase domain-containing protein n=1 Tax=Caenorhabditis auriculariae TaxID=2777116 RepID=A0A8S1GQZ8_9PELO|nr:unnamed protein product [Caenorhabditis auriculariae]